MTSHDFKLGWGPATTIALFLLVQTLGAVWWASGRDQKVADLESKQVAIDVKVDKAVTNAALHIAKDSATREKVDGINENLKSLSSTLAETNKNIVRLSQEIAIQQGQFSIFSERKAP